MNRKHLYVLLALMSIFAVAMLHYYHNSFFYDSFGYMKNAHFIMGKVAGFDPHRVGLVPFFIAPFVGHFFSLYLYYALITFLSLLIIVKMVDFFQPKNQEYILFFAIPSYATYVFTGVLQESFAMLFMALAIYFLLRKRYKTAICLAAVCALSRPAMLAFMPGFVLALLFYKYMFNDIDRNSVMASAYRSLRRNIVEILLYGTFCILLLLIIAVLYYSLLSFFFEDPFISFKQLSGRWDSDWKFIVGYPFFWFFLFGVFFSPVIAYCYYKIYNVDKKWFIFFVLMFLLYLLLIWYQANIRYVIYLIIPVMIGFSQIEMSSYGNYKKALLFIWFAFSTLYIFGPFVYVFNPAVDRRVIDVSFKPFIYFDSEYKSNQYRHLCEEKNKEDNIKKDVELFGKYIDMDYFNEYICK